MIRRAAAIFLGLHGLIHVIGFVVPWKLAVVDGQPYGTTAFFGLFDIGDTGVRDLGIVWLGVAIAFVVAGVAIWQRRRWAPGWSAGTAVVSAAICVVGLPSTAAGLVADVLIVVAFIVVKRTDIEAPGLWARTQPKALHHH